MLGYAISMFRRHWLCVEKEWLSELGLEWLRSNNNKVVHEPPFIIERGVLGYIGVVRLMV